MTDGSARANPSDAANGDRRKSHADFVKVLERSGKSLINLTRGTIGTMFPKASLERCGVALWLCAIASIAASQAPSGNAHDEKIRVTLIAEVAGVRGNARLEPAERVVPGNEVVYTVEIRNTTSLPRPPPTVDYPVPEHMSYVADSAVGAGAEVTFSTDGGATFARPDALFVAGKDGQKRPAAASDYTHIRWQLKHILKPNAVAFARFRAIVK
jgi:hypothetical protein